MFHNIFLYIKKYYQELFRFVSVGVFTFVINNLIFWLFNSQLTFDYKISITCSYFFTVICHFSLNRFFTYQNNSSVPLLNAVPKYLGMLMLNYFITLSVVFAAVEFFGLSPYFGILFSTFATGFSSFLLMNHFVFSRRTHN